MEKQTFIQNHFEDGIEYFWDTSIPVQVLRKLLEEPMNDVRAGNYGRPVEEVFQELRERFPSN